MDQKNTEKYAQECESQENYWHRNYAGAETIFLSKIDEAIASNNSEQFCSLIEDEKNYYVYANRPDYMLARLIYVMRLNELRHNSQTNILTCGNSLKELVKNAVTLPRFNLWRLELTDNIDAGKSLIDYCVSTPISFYSLCTLITTTSIDKRSVIIRLINICLEKSNITAAFILSDFFRTEYPNDPDALNIYQQLAELTGSN